jgi:hypothetical protein
VTSSAQESGDSNYSSLNLAHGANMVYSAARIALRVGLAFWGGLCVAVACRFQWGLFGPFNLSGLLITFLFALAHAHPIAIDNTKYTLHLVKLALTADFMVSVVLALGCLVNCVVELRLEPTSLSYSFLFVIASVASVRLAQLLERLSEPT